MADPSTKVSRLGDSFVGHLGTLYTLETPDTMSNEHYPLHATAIIYPLLAFLALLLNIMPMAWQFSHNNIAAGSLILWLMLLNFFNSINALIWPRDNVLQWWDGNVWCDIHVRMQIGAVIALSVAPALILRKLAKVMDTENLTVSTPRKLLIREKTLEIFGCWGLPLVMMVVYYIIQPIRYFILGISGCTVSYDSSWPSIVLNYMWGPLIMFVASLYAGLLIYRIYLYRRDFDRLIAARSTTKSRFIRLFLMAMIIICLYFPYNIYILYRLASEIKDGYDWNTVHGDSFNTAVKAPTNGNVEFDKWGQVISGYIVFLVFGTGKDAYNGYKRALCAIGLGKFFPSLHFRFQSGMSTPVSLELPQIRQSTLSDRAKGMLSQRNSVTETLSPSTQNRSVILPPQQTTGTETLNTVSSTEPLAQHPTLSNNGTHGKESFFDRIIPHRDRQQRILPVSTEHHLFSTTNPNESRVESNSDGVSAQFGVVENAEVNQPPLDVSGMRGV